MKFCAALLILSMLLTFGNRAYAAETTQSVLGTWGRPGLASDYQTWLMQFGALDVFQHSPRDQDSSPARLLDRARSFLEMNDANSVLELLAGRAPFKDMEAESQRLILLARAHRLMANMPASIGVYSQAARLMPPEALNVWLPTEPDLANLWQDVWRMWVWQYVRTPEPQAAQDLRQTVEQSLFQALSLWGDDDSWKSMAAAWQSHVSDRNPPELSAEFKAALPSAEYRAALAKLLAFLSLGLWDEAIKATQDLSLRVHRAFWRSIINFVRDGQLPEHPLGADTASFVKADAFLSDLLPNQNRLAGETWRIADSMIPARATSSRQLASADPGEALEIIEREFGSSLLAPETAQALRQMALAYAILLRDPHKAGSCWHALKLSNLPVSLKLAGMLLLGSETIPGERFGLEPELAAAAGLGKISSVRAPFWLAMDDQQVSMAMNAWPLDELLWLGSLKRAWERGPSSMLAKRLGLLFPDTPSGMQALLRLAEDAGKSGFLGLSATYLGLIDRQHLSPRSRATYLHSKARLEIELGYEDKALSTYEELLALNRNYLSYMQKLQLALLAQRRDRLSLAEELLSELWDHRADLEPGLQAEVLFYQAEVAQSSGQIETALDRYMHVAYHYPEQNIWAVTALYRAALLYERLGRYDVAGRILGTVIKSAGRESQKAAARDRLKAVESKRDQEQRTSEDQPFPF